MPDRQSHPETSACPHCGLANPGPEHRAYAPMLCAEYPKHVRTIETLVLVPGYTWRVDSDCGVVKVHSSRDGCLFAMNPAEARTFAHYLLGAISEAATSVDRVKCGGPR